MERVTLFFAMEQEAAPLLAQESFRAVQAPSAWSGLPFRFYEKNQLGRSVLVSVSGKDPRYGMDNIGLESAALQAFVTLKAFPTQLAINVGTAGSFASLGASVGDVYLSKDPFVFHDHRIPLGDFSKLGEGRYPSADTSLLSTDLGLKRAIVSSGNSLDFTAKDLEVFHSLGAGLKEMEAASTAYVCFLLQIPFFAIKSVTNLLDTTPDSAAAFVKNLETAVGTLTFHTLRVLQALSDKGWRTYLGHSQGPSLSP